MNKKYSKLFLPAQILLSISALSMEDFRPFLSEPSGTKIAEKIKPQEFVKHMIDSFGVEFPCLAPTYKTASTSNIRIMAALVNTDFTKLKSQSDFSFSPIIIYFEDDYGKDNTRALMNYFNTTLDAELFTEDNMIASYNSFPVLHFVPKAFLPLHFGENSTRSFNNEFSTALMSIFKDKKLFALPSEYQEYISNAQAQAIEHGLERPVALDLSGNYLASLPIDLLDACGIKELNIETNRFIGNFEKLEDLNTLERLTIDKSQGEHHSASLDKLISKGVVIITTNRSARF